MDAISQCVRVSLGKLGVASLDTDVFTWAVGAPSGYKPERVAIGSDAPWLLEHLALGACCLAGEPIHTTIKII